MAPDSIKQYTYPALTALCIVLLIVLLLPFFNLPYYWDEAWVYGKGVRMMCIHGPGLLPDSLPADISRGHPLLFYFTGSVWLRIFGNTIFCSHLFAAAVSVGTIIAVYKLCARFFSGRFGFIVVVLLMLQPIFLGQFCLVLPEMMLALWTILCLWAFFSGRKLLYILFATLLLLTKETGVICIFAIGLNELLFGFFRNAGPGENKFAAVRILKNYRHYLLIILPVLLASVHFIIQKKMLGWFFFPEHLGYISWKWSDISHKFVKYFSYLFIFDGRNGLFFGGLVSFFILLWRRKATGKPNANETQLRLLSALALFIFLYLSFCSVNFYSDRYLLSVIAPFVILSVFAIDAFLKRAVYKWIVFIVLFLTQGYYALNVRTNADHNPGYAENVRLYQEAVDYCIQEKFQNKKIYAELLMKDALSDTLSGYIRKDDVFKRVNSDNVSEADLYIFSSLKKNPYSDSIKSNLPLTLLKTIKGKKMEIQIFAAFKK